MQKIIAWFETVPSRKEFWKIVWLVLLTEVTISIVYFAVLLASGVLATTIEEINEALRAAANEVGPPQKEEELSLKRDIVLPALVWIVLAGIIAPVVEEFIFRLMPMTIAILLFKWSRFTKPLILFVTLPAGLVFGLLHLTNEGTTLSSVLLLQGVGGVVYGLIFAKMSGLRMKGVLRAYGTTVLMHGLWNTFMIPLVMVIVLIGIAPYVALSVEIPPELLK